MKFKEFFEKAFYILVDFYPFMYRPQMNIFKHKFEIHKTDADVWPSYPHMHSLEDKLVLDIYTGEVYRKPTRQCINEASEEDMIKLWNDRKFLNVVLEMRKTKPINVKTLSPIPIEWLNEESIEKVKEYDANYK